jgi:tRNA(Ile)-lysidine synthase
LCQLEGFDVRLANHSAAALDDARIALNWMVNELACEHIIHSKASSTLNKTDFPHEILRRLLLRSLHIIEPALSPRGEQLERTISALTQGETVTIGNILCKGGEKWTFNPAPKRQNS